MVWRWTPTGRGAETMCGRIAVTLPNDAMAQMFAALPANNLPKVPNFNVCPTTAVHVISTQNDQRHLSAMRWGFLPQWYASLSGGPLLINARAETIAQKPAFRDACRMRRCLVPVAGYYEWTKDAEGKRLPWYVQAGDGATLALAGVWQDWGPEHERIRSTAIVTTAANASLASVHHRMPVIIAQKDWGLWLGEEGKGAATLMQAAPEDALQFHRVATTVNSNRATGEELVTPLAL